MGKKKVVLITGATGFIGLTFLKYISKLKTYKIVVISRNNKKKVPNVFWIKDRLPLGKNSLNLIKKLKVDYLYHFAWQGIPNFTKKNCLYNFNISKDFIDFMILNTKICKIIVTGTCWEYSTNGQCSENIKAKPLNNFAKYKIKLYEHINNKITKSKINFYWLRLFYIFGPNQRENSLIPYLIKNTLNGKEIILKNKKNLLDYLSVDEVAIVLKKFLYLKPQSGIYNVGSGKKIDLITIIKAIEKNLKKKVFIKYEKNKTKNLRFWSNLKKIKNNVRWKPKTTFNKAIKKTIKFYVKKNKN